MALRRTAERVDAQMDAYNIREGIREAQPVSDKIMVCIGPDPLSAKLIRTARRMAVSHKAPWVAVYVENFRHYRLSEAGKAAVEATMRLAERMGGKSIVLQGDNASETVIAYARETGVTKIILGKPDKPRWKDFLYGSFADAIIRKSGHIDAYIVTAEEPPPSTLFTRKSGLTIFKPQLYFWSVATIAVVTILGMALVGVLRPIDQALLYLMGCVLVAARFGAVLRHVCAAFTGLLQFLFHSAALYTRNL